MWFPVPLVAAFGVIAAQPSATQAAVVTTIFRQGSPVSFEELVSAAAEADVVCVGEQHDHADGHEFELRLLEAVGAKCPRLVLSLEMFERDVQLVLDEYLTGHVTESAFLAAARPWPRYATDYRPLVEWCRKNGRPVVAANVPRRYVNIVSRHGQSALLRLPKASRTLLPPLPYSMDLSAGYEAALDAVFSSAHGASGSGMPDSTRMKEAQALWDHGMAQSILKARLKFRAKPVLHVVGSMHCEYGYGIVERLRRHARKLRVLVVVVRPIPPAGAPPLDPKLGDFIVVTGSSSEAAGKAPAG